MFTGSGSSGGPPGSKNPYASSQASKSLSATFSSQGSTQSTPWQNRSNTTFGTPNTNFGGGFGGNPGTTSTGFGGLAAGQPSTGFGSTSTPAVDSSGSTGWTSRSPGGFNLSSKPSAPGIQPNINPVTFKCRMCQSIFTTSEDLKKHIKTEGHFDTSRAPANTFGGSNFPGQQAPRAFNSQPLGKGDSPAGGLFGLPSAGRDTGAAADGSGNLNATAAPFTPQPRSAPFGQAFGQPRAPRGAPLGAGGPPPPSTAPPQGIQAQPQQPPQKTWDKPKASQDARQQQAPRPFVPSQPPRQGTGFGQSSFVDTQNPGPGQGVTAIAQDKPAPPANANPYARPGATFGNSSANASGPSDAKSYPFVPYNAAPRPFSSSKVPSTGFGGLQTVPEKSLQGGASAAKDALTRSGLGTSSVASNSAYHNLSSADEGHDDAEDDGEEEEDDLNFSFSSQESATGDINSTHSSPMKGPGLGSPAAAARARAEEVPQRALFSQSTPAPVAFTSHNSAPSFGVSSQAVGNSSQAGATSSLMGFMKASSKFPPASASMVSPQPSHQQSSQQSGMPLNFARTGDDSTHGSDTESNADGTDAMGTCEDMCPPEERTKRLNESDIHKLEIPHPDMTPGRNDYAFTMVKKFQRSSADHALQIPHLLRTPEALLRSIEYIENELMDRASKGVFDPRIGEAPSTLFIYLFVWDRYRMVAKDFTLQQSMLPLTRIWVECHERMARWFILMDHKMQAADDFISAGHGQQNGESLNNLLKTLHGYFFRSRVGADAAPPSAPIDMPNKAEFVCYFVLFQLGNGGEVSKYLQQLPDEMLNSPQVRFAIEVWGALKTQNYAKYFRLLRTRATLLQACLMHRYMGEVRLTALKKLTRSLNPPGNKPQEYLLKDLMSLFMFESVAECVEFVEHCGLTCCASSAADLDPAKAGTPTEDFVVLLSGQNIDHLLPRDKNDRAIPPPTRYMGHAIDTIKCLRNSNNVGSGECFSIAEVCRGLATGGSAPVFAPPAPASTSTRSAALPIQYPTQSKKTGEIGVRVPTTMSSPSAVSNQATTATTTPTTSFSATPAVPVLTEAERSAAKARFLAGMGSGRGAKKAASPIAPVTDADVWGPPDGAKRDTKSEKDDKKSNKRITPTFGAAAAAAGSVGDLKSGSFGGNSWAKPNVPSVPGAGGFAGSGAAKPSGFPFGAASATPSATTGAGAGASQDSWRRAAPSAGVKDAQQDRTSGNTTMGSSSDGQQKVSATSAFPSAVPVAVSTAVPVPAVSTATAPVTADPRVVAALATMFIPGASTIANPAVSSLPAFPSFAAPAAATTSQQAEAPPAPTTTATAAAAAAGPSTVPAASFSTGPTPQVTPTAATHAVATTSISSSTLNPASAVFVPGAAKIDVSKKDTAHSIDAKRSSQPDSWGNIIDIHAAHRATPVRPQVDQAKLDAFQRRIAHKQHTSMQKSVLRNWRTTAYKAANQRQARLTALYFLLWRQGCKRNKRERAEFISDITSIQMVDPLTQELDGMKIFGNSEISTDNRENNVLKRKQAQQLESQRRLQCVAEKEVLSRYTLLCDAESSLSTNSTQEGVYSTSSVRQQRHVKSLLDTVGRTLRAVKTLQLHTLLGLPVAPSALQALRSAVDVESKNTIEGGPQFTGALCFKVAVLSDCTTAGVMCKHGQASEQCTCNGFSNALRSQLANERGYGYHTTTNLGTSNTEMSKAQLGKMKKRRGQLARALATKEKSLTAVRVGLHTHQLDAHTSLQLSVVDVCGSGTIPFSTVTVPATDLTAHVQAVTDLTSTQGVMVVINTNNAGYVTSALRQLLQCTEQKLPVVLVLFHKTSTITTSEVQEISKEDLLYSDAPSSPCSVARRVLSEMGAALPVAQRDSFLSLVQGSIVVDTPLSQSATDFTASAVASDVTRWCMQRALQLLAVAAPPTPVVLRVRPDELLLHHLNTVKHSHRSTELNRHDNNSQGGVSVSEQSIRAVGHTALEKALTTANDHLHAIIKLLQQQQRSNSHYDCYPTTDFLSVDKVSTQCSKTVSYLASGVLDLSNLMENPSAATAYAAPGDLLLPRNWAETLELAHFTNALQALFYSPWSPEQSISSYQDLLVSDAKKQNANGSVLRAGAFVSALEEVLNRAYVTRQVAHLPGAIDKIIHAITVERMRNLYDTLPNRSVYIALDEPASLVEWVKTSTDDSESMYEGLEHQDSTEFKDTSYEMYTSHEAIMMSPSGNVYIEQSQYAQAFPTGFGRSLFAQFSRDSILTSDTPKIKRAFDAEGFGSNDKRAKYNAEDLHSTTPQRGSERGNYGDVTPQSAGYGIAYDKLFGSAAKNTTSISSAPSTPHTTAPTDLGTRALHSQVRSEQAATDRLNNMLEAALSPLRSPTGVRNNATFTPTSGNKQAQQQDPMQFIAECRRERERFEAVVTL